MSDKKTVVQKKIRELEDNIQYMKEMHELTTNDNVKDLWEEDIKKEERALKILKGDEK